MPKCKHCKIKFEKKYAFQQFCLSDDECIKAFNESVKYAKEKQKAKQWQKEKKEIKEKLMTKSDYEKLLQKEINTIVRLIDKGFICISSGKPLNDKFDAGHFYSVGSNPSLRFNLLNIYAQSVYANQYLSGDQINFINGINENYGSGLKSIVLRLKKDYPIIKLTQEELKEKTITARSIVKHLKMENKIYNSVQRIDLRRKFNKMIGIYN